MEARASQLAYQRKNPINSIKATRLQKEKVTDSYLASCRGMSVEHLRQYPRPVIELWKTLLKISRIQKQITVEIDERQKNEA